MKFTHHAQACQHRLDHPCAFQFVFCAKLVEHVETGTEQGMHELYLVRLVIGADVAATWPQKVDLFRALVHDE